MHNQIVSFNAPYRSSSELNCCTGVTNQRLTPALFSLLGCCHSNSTEYLFPKMSMRRASHAGSWYSDSAKELSRQLGDWLNNTSIDHRPARALIVPHAGYQYCGACGAHAYNQIDPSKVKTIFILGPSHHVRVSGCALSPVLKYRTPLYDLVIDSEIYNELWGSGLFERMSLTTDEDEHSIEMQLPFIAKVMENHRAFKIVPILVGALNPEKEAMYGKLLAKYLKDPSNVFVISSDFCHWGQRFRYTYYDKSIGEIYQSIQHLDQMAMDIIEQLVPSKFTDYLKKYGNTICGRHPIGVLLQTIQALRDSSNNLENVSLKFLNYAQSGQCYTMSDSSVSYAAAVFKIM